MLLTQFITPSICSSLSLPLSLPSFILHPYSLQGTLEYITMAAISKVVAVSTTYPYQVIRARLQVSWLKQYAPKWLLNSYFYLELFGVAVLEPSVTDSLGTSGWNMPNRTFKHASVSLKAVFTKGTRILQLFSLISNGLRIFPVILFFDESRSQTSDPTVGHWSGNETMTGLGRVSLVTL